MPRGAVNALKRLTFALFLLLERIGIHVLPVHYYTPVADRRWLRRNPALWRAPLSLPGVALDLDEQLRWLEHTCSAHYDEVEGLGRFRALAATPLGQGYGPIESQVLHCFIRSQAPPLVVEIGSGLSTAAILEAGELNAAEGRRAPHVVAVEPFPHPGLEQLQGIELIRDYGQSVPPDVFDRLQAGDLLFIDSTHGVKTGSEVLRLYLEIVPRLPAGVVVHIHDVFLPYAYPRSVLSSYFDWQESSFVAALLTHSSQLAVLCCQSALHYARPGELRRILPDYRPRSNDDGLDAAGEDGDFPSSLWLQTR